MYFLFLLITKACVSLCLSPNHPVTQSDRFICHIPTNMIKCLPGVLFQQELLQSPDNAPLPPKHTSSLNSLLNTTIIFHQLKDRNLHITWNCSPGKILMTEFGKVMRSNSILPLRR